MEAAALRVSVQPVVVLVFAAAADFGEGASGGSAVFLFPVAIFWVVVLVEDFVGIQEATTLKTELVGCCAGRLKSYSKESVGFTAPEYAISSWAEYSAMACR